MEEKHQFITLAQSGRFTISELCESFEISRKTGHKWLNRYAEDGFEGLLDKSRAPKSVPLRTEEHIERLIVSERRQGVRTLLSSFLCLSLGNSSGFALVSLSSGVVENRPRGVNILSCIDVFLIRLTTRL